MDYTEEDHIDNISVKARGIP